MAQIHFNTPLTFVRTGKEPLTNDYIFNSQAEAIAYAQDLDSNAYIGQQLAVVENGKVELFVIESLGALGSITQTTNAMYWEVYE